MSEERKRRIFRLDVGREHVERDVDTELAFHIEMRTRKLVSAGMDPAAARAKALRQFGDLAAVRAECLDIDRQRERAVERTRYLDELRQDTAYALRSLRQRAGFAAIVLLTLAVGIGANSAIFTVIDALLLRTLPVPNPEQLVAIGNQTRVGSVSQGLPRTDIYSYPLYKDLRDRNHFVTGLMASGRTGRMNVLVKDDTSRAPSAAAEPEHPRGRFVSGNYFSVLGVRPLLGRTFGPAEDEAPGRDPVAVIGYGYWQRRFGGGPNAVGRTVVLNGTPLTIVGVMPRGFFGDIVGTETEIWIPIMMQPSLQPNREWLADRNTSWLLLMGRLAPGVSLGQARAGFATLTRQSITENLRMATVGPSLQGQLDDIEVGSGAKGFSRVRVTYGSSLWTLMAAVALVLLVVCANVANLMLARAAARAREIAVRMAIGAGRRRIVRQLFTESVVLAILGGALGLLFATWGSKVLLRLASGDFNGVPLDLRQDRRVLAFTAALSLLTAILFGLAPALRATRVDLATVLRAQARGVTGAAGSAGRRFEPGRVLVVLQVALALLLLVGTSMLVRSIRNLGAVDTGLERERLLIVTVNAERTIPPGPRRLAIARELLQRVRSIAGVAAASFSENGIFSGTESATTLTVEGFQAQTNEDTVVNYDRVGPDYFHTIGARILQGRDIGAQDDEHAAKVAVVNATMAKFFYPNGDVLGRRLKLDSVTYYAIVGVVADIQDHGLRDKPVRRLYLPVAQTTDPPGNFSLELRAAGDPAGLVAPTRQAVRDAASSVDVLENKPLVDLMRESVSEEHLLAQVASFFGILTLALAALGLYGVMAHATMRRTSEFGLRMALGAEPGDVLRMVLREALVLVAIGAVVGLPAALAAMRLLQHQLFGVAFVDPPSILVALVVLGASAALAGYLPAARAARVGPLVALRAD
jgi:putative ABC transport system permease protein